MKLAQRVEKIKNELIARDGAICKKCGSIEDLSIDHIIPYSMLLMLGKCRNINGKIKGKLAFERLDWLELLCRKCNQKKGSTVDWDNPRSKIILHEIIDNF
jgi:5-methylcytosine-specific restriction endonuclease McrA